MDKSNYSTLRNHGIPIDRATDRPGRGGEVRAHCPQCDPDRRRGKALSVNTDRQCWLCHRCGWRGRLDGKTTLPERQPARTGPDNRREKLNATWAVGYPLSDARAGIGLAYLRHRGLPVDDLPCDIRLHPHLAYWDTSGDRPRYIGGWPALLALVRDAEGRPASIHRTWLQRDGQGKAPVADPKKLMSSPLSIRGGAVRLYPATDRVGLAEGTESALALRLLHPELPVWSCICADMLQRVTLPESIRRVMVAVDNDASGKGQTAVRILSARLAKRGVRTTLLLPDRTGDDVLDELRRAAS